MDQHTILIVVSVTAVCLILFLYLFIRHRLGGGKCVNKSRLEDKVIVVVGADHATGEALVRALSVRQAAKIILCVEDPAAALDFAVEMHSTTNVEIVVENCNLASLKSVRKFCSKILETESKLHALINHGFIMWAPFTHTPDGNELHWSVNYLAHFLITAQLLPLLQRAGPDARVVNVISGWHKFGWIHWDDPNFCHRKYSANQAFFQSQLANVLFSKELARRLESSNVNVYAAEMAPVVSGLGFHSLQGLGFLGSLAALLCWLPWLSPATSGIQTVIHCVTEPSLSNQSGFYYKRCRILCPAGDANNCSEQDAYRLWEMSERMVGM